MRTSLDNFHFRFETIITTMRVIILNKQKLLEVFEEVLKSWEMAQGCVIQEGDISESDFDDLEKGIEEYRQRFIKALND